MNLTNKQHVSNLLAAMYGNNATNINLPKPDGTKNSDNDNRTYATTWSEEFWEVREADPYNTISIAIDGAELYAYNFELDGKPVHLVALDYDTIEPEGVVLLDGHCNNQLDVIDSWLGNTTLAEYENHIILELAEAVKD
jgi:hypothetical protein